MKIFISRAGLPDNAMRTLSTFPGVIEYNLDGENGFLFEDSRLKAILELLEAKVAETELSSMEDKLKARISFNAQNPVETKEVSLQKQRENLVVWNGHNSYAERRFKPIFAEILVPALQGRFVRVRNTGSGTTPPKDINDFQVFIFSAPSHEGGNTPHTPEKIWGHQSRNLVSYPFSGEGINIKDIESGYSVAELVADKALYVHFELFDGVNDSEEKILRHLLNEVVMELTLPPEQKVEREVKRAEEARIRSRELFVKACSKRFQKVISATKEEIQSGHRSINELQEQIVKKVRETSGAERKLQQLLSAGGISEEEYSKEFDRFFSIADVKGVEVDNNKIKVFTDMIYIIHENVKYKIGEFQIDIYTDGSHGGLRFKNLTTKGRGPQRTRDDFDANSSYNNHHPHVDNDGVPCLGTIQGAVGQLIGEYQYSVVAILAIQFLKSVNAEDGAGRGIIFWPKTKKKVMQVA